MICHASSHVLARITRTPIERATVCRVGRVTPCAPGPRRRARSDALRHGQGRRRCASPVAQTSESSVSRVSKPADRSAAPPTWKSAIRKSQKWKLAAAFLALTAIAGRAADSAPAAAPPPAHDQRPRTLRVAGAQLPVTNDIQKNLQAITRAIEFAANAKADVLVTPEGSLSGYTSKFDPAATTQALETVVQLARQSNLALVLGTCFADPDGSRYDAQRFYDRTGAYLGFHAKVLLCRHLTEPGRKGELDSFKSAPLRTFQFQGLTVGGLVCNDFWANPEWTPMPDPHLAFQLAGLGASVIFLSVNSGQAEGDELALHRAFHESNLSIRARTSKLWVVVANACDVKGLREVNCRSGVIAPDGHWAVQANPLGEQFFAYTISLE
jgi:predicted amidohydrolase